MGWDSSGKVGPGVGWGEMGWDIGQGAVGGDSWSAMNGNLRVPRMPRMHRMHVGLWRTPLKRLGWRLGSMQSGARIEWVAVDAQLLVSNCWEAPRGGHAVTAGIALLRCDMQ